MKTVRNKIRKCNVKMQLLLFFARRYTHPGKLRLKAYAPGKLTHFVSFNEKRKKRKEKEKERK